MVNLREAVLADVYRLAPRLREQDLNEVWASSHLNGEGALMTSYFGSEFSFSAEYNGEVIAMWGVAKLQGTSGATIWFLGSEEVAKFTVKMFRDGRRFVQEALNRYGYLMNYVDARNTLSIKWLRWLGFCLEEPKPYGKDGLLFHYFYAKIPSVGNLN